MWCGEFVCPIWQFDKYIDASLVWHEINAMKFCRATKFMHIHTFHCSLVIQIVCEQVSAPLIEPKIRSPAESSAEPNEWNVGQTNCRCQHHSLPTSLLNETLLRVQPFNPTWIIFMCTRTPPPPLPPPPSTTTHFTGLLPVTHCKT